MPENQTPAPTHPIFPALHHVCIVVADLQATEAYYTSVGIGPWHDFPPLEPFEHDLVTPDNEAFLTTLTYRWAEIGPGIQLQLCEPGEGNTPQRKFLDEHGGGVFHLGFTTDDVDASETRATALGLGVLLHGRVPSGAGFSYFDTRDESGVVLQARQAAQ